MKKLLQLCFAVVVLSCITGQIAFAEYPDRPIKVIIPYGAGGTTDIAVRMLASIAEKDLGQPVVVENKPGGSGTIGLAAVAKAAPDGYTLIAITSSPYFITPHLRKVSYNPVEDFAPIMNYSGPHHGVVVPSSSEFHSFKDLIDYGKKNPGTLTYGTAGTFAGAHISMLYMEKLTGAQFTHLPFKGSAAATAAVLGGHVNFALVPAYSDHIKAGSVRVLAVLDETKDVENPEIPTIGELGYDWAFVSVVGLAAPAKTPGEVIAKLEKAFIKAAGADEFKQFMAKANLPIEIMNSEDFGKVLKKNYARYGKAIKELKLAE